jgi:hypothetical protein
MEEISLVSASVNPTGPSERRPMSPRPLTHQRTHGRMGIFTRGDAVHVLCSRRLLPIRSESRAITSSGEETESHRAWLAVDCPISYRASPMAEARRGRQTGDERC